MILFEVIWQKGQRKSQRTTGFIRYFDQLFGMLQIVVLLIVFDVLQSREMQLTFSGNPIAFMKPSDAISQKRGTISINKRQVL